MKTNLCLLLFCQAFATIPLRSKDKKMDVIAVDNAFHCPTTDEDVGIPVAWEEIHERILKVKQRILKVEQRILEVEQMTKARYNGWK